MRLNSDLQHANLDVIKLPVLEVCFYMTSLGFPGLSSQSVSGCFGSFRPENYETDWDDKPGFPDRKSVV